MNKFEDKFGRPVRVGDRVQTYTDMYGHNKIEGRVIEIELSGENKGEPIVDIHILIDKVYKNDCDDYGKEEFPNPNTVGQTWISGDCSEWYLRLDGD